MVIARDGEFRELTWQDLDPSNKHVKVGRTEVLGWIIGGLFVVLVFMLMAPVQQMVLSDEQLVAIYTRQYPWLNRCSEECEDLVNTAMLHQQTNCKTLTQWFNMERRKYMLEWRIAIDDRATSLGCSSFPRSMTAIEQSIRRTEVERRQRIAQLKMEKQQEIEAEQAAQIPRFEASMLEGGIRKFVYKFYQDPVDQDIMVMALTEEFFELPYRLQLQVAEVYWKKWASIRNQQEPEFPRLRLLNTDNDVIGGSPPEAATPIWIKQPGT